MKKVYIFYLEKSRFCNKMNIIGKSDSEDEYINPIYAFTTEAKLKNMFILQRNMKYFNLEEHYLSEEDFKEFKNKYIKYQLSESELVTKDKNNKETLFHWISTIDEYEVLEGCSYDNEYITMIEEVRFNKRIIYSLNKKYFQALANLKVPLLLEYFEGHVDDIMLNENIALDEMGMMLNLHGIFMKG